MGRLAYGKSDISCSIVTPQAKIPDQPNRLYSICNRRHRLYLRLVCEWPANAIRPTVKGLYMVAVLQNCNLLIPKIVRDRYRTVQVLAVILRTKK